MQAQIKTYYCEYLLSQDIPFSVFEKEVKSSGLSLEGPDDAELLYLPAGPMEKYTPVRIYIQTTEENRTKIFEYIKEIEHLYYQIGPSRLFAEIHVAEKNIKFSDWKDADVYVFGYIPKRIGYIPMEHLIRVRIPTEK